MYKAFGIVNPSGRRIWVDGLEDYRPIGAFSFMGRYRIIDFPISNLNNSGIDRIQIYLGANPRSLADHLGTGRQYNINSKRGNLQILYSTNTNEHNSYNTDIATYAENMEFIEGMHNPYVVIVPTYMVYTMDYSELITAHVESGADVSLLYHSVDTADTKYLACNTLTLNKQKGVTSITPNNGAHKNRHIFMDTYVMKTKLFKELVRKAQKISSMYTLADIINDECTEGDVRGYAHHGYFASITDFESYYEANMSLINYDCARDLFHSDWPIYTRTNDSCPTQYCVNADVKNSIVSNGCHIEGTIENSIIGRGVTIKKGATVRNSIVLADAIISEDTLIENQVIDKRARILKTKEIVSPADKPGYIRRADTV